LRHLWDGHQDRAGDIACFLCSAPVERPICCIVLPETNPGAPARDQLIATAICRKCGSLPNMQRLSRCLKILKRMAYAKTGKRITFSANHGRHHHPR
jgi:hypothetical protein